MKLYGGLASPYVARVAMLARLKGLDLVPEMPEGGLKTPSYLAMNPMGKMPTLEVDGTAIPESQVICDYLDDLFAGQGAMPTDALARARARLVARVHDVYVSPHASTLFRNLNPASRDAATVETAKEGVIAGFGYIEQLVTATPFAVGPSLTVADCALLPSLAMLRKTAFPAFQVTDPTAGSGRLAQWWRNVAEDPVAGAFLKDYEAAVDAFLRMLSARR
jgi:glutathione S-transferase